MRALRLSPSSGGPQAPLLPTRNPVRETRRCRCPAVCTPAVPRALRSPAHMQPPRTLPCTPQPPTAPSAPLSLPHTRSPPQPSAASPPCTRGLLRIRSPGARTASSAPRSHPLRAPVVSRSPAAPAHAQLPAHPAVPRPVHPWSPAHPQPPRTHSSQRTRNLPQPSRAPVVSRAPRTEHPFPCAWGGLSNDGPELVLWGGSPSPRGHLCRPAWGAESTPRSPAGVRPPGAPYPHTNHDEVVLAVLLEPLVEAERLCRDSAQHGPAGGGGDQRGRGAEWDQRGAGGRGRGQRGARGEGSGRC